MFWDDIPFEARAQFMKDNVMELSADVSRAFPPDEHPGLENFRELLLAIYGAPDAFPGANPLERFHALSYSTQLFFSALATSGEIAEDGRALYVTKADFKKVYKKPGSTPFALLPAFGIRFAYAKKERAAASYSACDAFVVRFPREGIPAVLKRMAKHYPEVDHKDEYCDAPAMLGKADYDRLVLGRPAVRRNIDPLRADILRSTGAQAPLYREMIDRAHGLGYRVQCSMQRYANPTWNVNIYHGKKLWLKSLWCETRNFIHLPVPFAQADPVILDRRQYPPRVTEAIERFGCVRCGRCQAGKTVGFKKVDGITICNGHGESSTIFITLKTMDEMQSLLAIAQSLDAGR